METQHRSGNFFAAEDRAKKATVVLVVLYILAIAGVVLATDVVMAAIVSFYMLLHGGMTFEQLYAVMLPIVGLVVTSIVLGATWSKAKEIQGGGTVFGAMLGGRFLADAPTDPGEIRLKDVVEEMALAAGVKAPAICVLGEEPRINAFAAGTNNVDPVIGVTAGCLDYLTRDELQAIVGHEFSHILHNDTVLNTRAYSMVFGLVAISVIGEGLIGASSSRDDYSDRSDAITVLIGIILCTIGGIGGLAGRLIRAAIVRQREFLADASAVQYTRDANSLASALYKMARTGSHLKHSTGEEAEHFLFGAGSCSAWGRFGLTRTHPTIAKRIKAVCPDFEASGNDALPIEKLNDDDGFPIGESLAPTKHTGPYGDKYPLANSLDEIPGAAVVGGAVLGAASVGGSSRAGMPASVGTSVLLAGATPLAAAAPKPTALEAPLVQIPFPPAPVLSKVPAELQKAAGDAETAAAVCFALAAADLPRERWAALLGPFADADTTAKVQSALPAIKPLSLEPRLALLDILVPTIAKLPSDEQAALEEAVAGVLTVTPQPDIVALAVHWRLQRFLRGREAAKANASTWAECAEKIAVLVAATARLEYGAGVLAPNAYSGAAAIFSRLGGVPTMPPAKATQPADIHAALGVIANASPEIQDATIDAVARIIEREEIPVSLADLMLRLVCDAAGGDVPEAVGRWL